MNYFQLMTRINHVYICMNVYISINQLLRTLKSVLISISSIGFVGISSGSMSGSGLDPITSTSGFSTSDITGVSGKSGTSGILGTIGLTGACTVT